MNFHDVSGIAAIEFFVFKGVAQESEEHAVGAEGRLDDVGKQFV